MPIEAGSRLGRYQIHSLLGSGGMGEVYRARDTQLDRTVAIKLIRRAGVDGLEESRRRFEREAKAIATLNHSNVCTIHDVGRQDSTDYLVMEYLEGETLAEKLSRGATPINVAIETAIGILDGLAEAHRNGILHRDLKPGNIMLTRSGVKLMDFGLAKSFLATDRTDDLATELITSPVTSEGLIVGTLEYMAPEQLEGRPATERSDIFSFGAVLYEMVTGRRAFSGNTRASVIAAVLTSEPPSLAEVQPMTTLSLDRLLRSCLAKNPESRWSSVHDLRIQLDWIRQDLDQPQTGPRPRSWLWPAVAAGLVLLLAAALGFSRLGITLPAASTNAMHFLIHPPENLFFDSQVPPAISPDGKRLALATVDASGMTRIWVRPLDSTQAQPVAGTESGSSPFWSPDGKWIGFHSDGKVKRASTDGGTVQTITAVRGFFGASWSRADQIVFATAFRMGPLMSVPAGGGEPKIVTTPSVQRSEIGGNWPAFLPDGRHFLYYNVTTERQRRGIVLASTDRPEARIPLLPSQTNGVFVPDGTRNSGHILYQRDGNLMARRFDLERQAFDGDAALAVEQVAFHPMFRRGMFSASENNVLAFRSGEAALDPQLTWYDRTGREVGALTAPAAYVVTHTSKDGTGVVAFKIDTRTGGYDIWTIDTTRGVPSRLTFEASDAIMPLFSPDGSRVLFSSNRDGRLDLYTVSSSGGGSETLVLKDNKLKFPSDWTRDGKFIIYTGGLPEAPPGDNVIWALPVSTGKPPVVLLKSKFLVGGAYVSPDGKYLSYGSIETGRPEIYVREFKPEDPNSARRWQISADGGSEASWDPSGKELYFISSTGDLMGVHTSGLVSTERLTPRPLFRVPMPPGPARVETTPVRRYAVLNSNRFLILKSRSMEDKSPVHVLVNWTAALRK
jgi:serine/threonine protein kinase